MLPAAKDDQITFRGVKQTYHTSEHDPMTPFNYFRDIDLIAHWLGSALVTRTMHPHRDVYATSSTTIMVDCVKEKLGTVRVYCNLASESLVSEAWEREKPVCYTDAAPHDFKFRNLLKDARHYRQTYDEAFQLWPHYAYAISVAANYPVLLIETLDELLRMSAEELRLQENLDLLSVARMILTEEHVKIQKTNQGR